MVGEPLDEASLPSLEKPIIPVDFVGIKVRKENWHNYLKLETAWLAFFNLYLFHFNVESLSSTESEWMDREIN